MKVRFISKRWVPLLLLLLGVISYLAWQNRDRTPHHHHHGTQEPPLPPEKSLAKMQVLRGFRIELVASEPEIIKPISLTFDEKGRIWVVESVDYPSNILPRGQGNDRIKVCEDKNHDGVIDECHVFADHLNIPTSLVFAEQGVIVANAPDILFFKDDGHGIAGPPKVLMTGFGRVDTHQQLNHLTYGLDNWLYGVVGTSGGEVTIRGKKISFGAGVFRFRPDGSDFEMLATSPTNTWGVAQTENGAILYSQVEAGHIFELPIPLRLIKKLRGFTGEGKAAIEDHTKSHPITSDVVQLDYKGSYTAATGLSLYQATLFPAEFQNKASFIGEPTLHLVHYDRLEKKGSGWIAHDGENLIASRDPWTTPVDTVLGPDGAVWIVDWYNSVIHHNIPWWPVTKDVIMGPGMAFKSTERDHSRGRIYRIVPESSPRQSYFPPDLSRASSRELTAALGSDNKFLRLTAQRMLVERKVKADVPALVAAAHENNWRGVHALRTLQGLDYWKNTNKEDFLLHESLTSPFVPKRMHALSILSETGRQTAPVLKSGSLFDDEAEVRLTAALALAEGGTHPDLVSALSRALRDSRNYADRWVMLALQIASGSEAGKILMSLGKTSPKDQDPAAPAIESLTLHYALGTDLAGLETLLSVFDKASDSSLAAFFTGLNRAFSSTAQLPMAFQKTDIAFHKWYSRVPATSRPFLSRLMNLQAK